jgi:hypothetical protein
VWDEVAGATAELPLFESGCMNAIMGNGKADE